MSRTLRYRTQLLKQFNDKAFIVINFVTICFGRATIDNWHTEFIYIDFQQNLNINGNKYSENILISFM